MPDALLLLLTLVSASLAGGGEQAHDQPLRPERHAQVDAVFAEWNHTDSPGCAIAIDWQGTIDYTRGYGMSNLEQGVAIGPESIFHVASISKQFTAFAIALLAQDGKLSWDDDVRTHIPELPDYGQRITLRHLAQHTSGLRDQWSLLDLAGWRDDDLITQEDVLAIAARQRGLNFEPGAEYLYSNTGYTLLAIVVQRVSGQNLRAFAQARIFGPLGMRETHVHDDHTMIVPRRTSAYQRRGESGWRVSIPVFDTYGATSLFTTTTDLITWSRNFREKRGGTPALFTELLTSGTLTGGSQTGYGLGVSVGTYRGLPTIGHSGSDAGYRADFVLFPEHQLAVVALCNGSTIAPGRLTRKVAEIYLGDKMTADPATITTTRTTTDTVGTRSADARAGNAGTINLPSGHIDATPAPAAAVPNDLAGVYWNPRTDEVRRLQVKEGRLFLPGQPQPLVAVGSDTFRTEGSATEYRLVAPAAGRPRALHITTPPLPTGVFEQLLVDGTPAPARDEAALKAFTGTYTSDEVDATYTVTVKDGRLVVQARKMTPLRLEPLAGDRFSSTGGLITFTRSASKAIDGLTISTGRVRRLRFARQVEASAAARAPR